MDQERFVDYLFMLYRREIPELLKPHVDHVEDEVVYWHNKDTGMSGGIILGEPPYENMAPLGFALMGMLWPFALPNVDKIIAKRWKASA